MGEGATPDRKLKSKEVEVSSLNVFKDADIVWNVK